MKTTNRSFFFYLILLMLGSSAQFLQAQNKAYTLAHFAVRAGAFDRLNTPITTSLDNVALPPATDELQLFETTNGLEKAVPMQLERGTRAQLVWVLDGPTAAGSVRTFELRQAPPIWKGAGVQVANDGQNLQITIGGKPVLSYRHALTPVPQGASPLFERAGYIHPLTSPKGGTITRIQPPDHYHHYGIWNPWTKTEFEGREVDFWNLYKGQGTVRVKATPFAISGPVFGQIQALHEHIVFKDSTDRVGKAALNEEWDVRVWNADPKGQVWIVDFTTTQACATPQPLTVQEYRYQGFGMRANALWDDQTATLLTSEGKNKADGNGTRARWCLVSGPTTAGKSGVVFLTHPANFNFPEPIRIWPVGTNEGKENVFFNFNSAQDRDWKLLPGQRYALNYRMIVFDGELPAATAEQYWRDFANPPQVTVVPQASPVAQPKKVLVYTKNGKGYVHENIPNSIRMIQELGAANGFEVVASENPADFTEANLAQFDALIFSNTNNEIFDNESQKAAFQQYIRQGGAFVGIHSACGSMREWPWFWKVLGGKFHRHAPFQDFTVKVLDRAHPSTAHLPQSWVRNDECYYLKELNPDLRVLLVADMTTVEDDKKGEYPANLFGDTFPLAWYHHFEGGRQWYTSLGHSPEDYLDPVFRQHILGGILWALEGR